MPLEAATYIADLVPANPVGTDGKDKGDDHIRMIKQVLQNSLPGMSGAVTFGGWHLKTDSVNEQTTDYNVVQADDGKLVSFILSASKTLGLPSAATLGEGFVVWVQKDSSGFTLGVVSLVAETINEQSTIILGANEGGLLYSTGTAWKFIGAAQSLYRNLFLVNSDVDDTSVHDAIQIFRTRPTSAVNDGGGAVTWYMKNSVGAQAQVAAIYPFLTGRTAGAESAVLDIQIPAGGVYAPRIRIGQGVLHPSLTDQGAGYLNWMRLYISNDLVLPLSDLSQLTVPNFAADDRVLVRDTSGADHMYAALRDVAPMVKLAGASHSGTSLAIDIRHSAYKHRKIVLNHVHPGADAKDFWMRRAVDTVPTFITTSTYQWRNQSQSAGGLVSGGSESDTKIVINGSDTLGNVANENEGFVIEIWDISNGGQIIEVDIHGGGRTSTGGREEVVHGKGAIQDGTPITFIQFLLNDGSTFTCDYDVYGIA